VTESKGSLSVEARASRYIVGRVVRGRGLQEAFRDLVGEHGLRTGWVNAIGAFEWLELTEYNQAERRYEKAHRFERCELLSMQGNLSERDGEPFWHLHATVSLREGGRDVTYGGHVVDGVVFALEFRIDCFDELELRRDNDDATGLQLWANLEAQITGQELAPAPDAAPQGAPAEVTWAMAAELSASAEPAARPEYKPEKGDWIEHAKFGLCKIEGLTGDGVCIIKLPDARRKKIKIDALQVLAPRSDGGRRVFPVRPKPKG
jgi:predicted DNA-binding protein with PD1-like motif